MPAPESSDLIDLVDELDEPIGTVRRADALHQPDRGFRVVHVLVATPEGQVFLQRLADTRDRSPGRWGSSVAGYVHAGETTADAARRRAREEVGLATPLRKLGEVAMRDGESTKFVSVYLGEAEALDNAAPEQIAELRAVGLDEIRHMLSDQPTSFTETFPAVLDVYVAALAAAGPSRGR